MVSHAASVVAGVLLCVAGVAGQAVSPALRSELAPRGTLRAAINYNNPLLAQRDSGSGLL
jgi:hypothetical protein